MTEQRECPECGEKLAEGVTFCEACGAKVGATDEPPLAGPGETSSEVGTDSTSAGRRIALYVALGLLAIAAGFGAGYFVADDSDNVSSLETQLAAADEEIGDLESESEDLNTELDSVIEQRDDLETKLKAEKSISGDLPSPNQNISISADADYVMGEAGIVGPTVMRPTSLESTGPSGGGLRYELVVEVKNDGNQPISPFCGGDEATIVDASGREYSGESVLDFDTPNCSADIQPGLTKSGFTMEYTLPADAKPALIEIVFDTFSDEEPVSWAVK